MFRSFRAFLLGRTGQSAGEDQAHMAQRCTSVRMQSDFVFLPFTRKPTSSW